MGERDSVGILGYLIPSLSDSLINLFFRFSIFREARIERHSFRARKKRKKAGTPGAKDFIVTFSAPLR